MSDRKKISLIIILSLMTLPLQVSAKELVFGALEYLPPYHYRTEDGQWKGIEIEVGEEIAQKLGVRITYDGLPWTRMIKYARQGKIDGIISMFCLEKYLDILDFAESAITSEIAVFARKEDDIIIKGLDNLRGKTIGIIRGYSYSPEFAEYQGLDRREFDNDTVLVRVLEKKRIDVAVAEAFPFRYISKQLGFQNRFQKLYTITENQICMGFSKKALGAESKVLAEKVSRIFQRLKADGVIQKIVDKYIH